MLKPENLENLLSTLVVDSIAFNLATGEHSVWLFRTIDRKKKKKKRKGKENADRSSTIFRAWPNAIARKTRGRRKNPWSRIRSHSVTLRNKRVKQAGAHPTISTITCLIRLSQGYSSLACYNYACYSLVSCLARVSVAQPSFLTLPKWVIEIFTPLMQLLSLSLSLSLFVIRDVIWWPLVGRQLK